MIQTCKQCGAVNLGEAQTCYFCNSRLTPNENTTTTPAGDPAPTEGSLAVEPDWRREVTDRLQAFRARRRRLHGGDSQTELPFVSPQPASENLDEVVERAMESSASSGEEAEFASPETAEVERMEIAVTQPDLDFLAAQHHPSAARPAIGSGVASFPVADLAERRLAGVLDASFLALAYGGFLGLFLALGGHLALGNKTALVVYTAILALFYALYFALFTIFGAATPGMLLRGLRLISFDGSVPTPRQLMWRSFGYLVSGGTVLLGFLWALWDEDHLCWQDRISQTYLTSRAASGEADSGSAEMESAPQGRL